jgi:D-tyrosyl-tRNA(Tyr) deacylase
VRALVQRVRYGAVTIDGQKAGEIGSGLVILLGVRNGDEEKDAKFLAAKCANLRIFPDENGNMNRSLLEVGGEALIISQFTLYGDTRKGRRPSFIDAARPEISEPLYEAFVVQMQSQGIQVATGKFGAMMMVEIHNDGPVTLMLESK